MESSKRMSVESGVLFRRGVMGCLAAALLWMAGCASPTHRAPVEDRRVPVRPGAEAPVAPPTSSAATVKPPPVTGPDLSGRAGFYTVKPGDTLIRIGLDAGYSWRDIARWNGLDNPNVIEVGQVLRVVPPPSEAGVASVRPVAPPGRVDSRPLDGNGPAGGAPAATPGTVSAPVPGAPGTVPSSPVAPVAQAPAASATAPGAAPAAAPPRDADDDLVWAWPSGGNVVAGFGAARSNGLTNGLTITGKAGDPVLAAADGRVIYAGSGLRGYGNLVIVQHNGTYITAYAHNQRVLVKDDDAVRRGQRIAEMGNSDADQVQLHFELRRRGRPVDPSKLLPPR